jgi:hypothetical protein
VVEGQVALGTAVLAAELVAQKQVEAGEGHLLLRLHVVLEDHHGGDPDRGGRRMDELVIGRHDLDPVEPGGLDRLLPRPERQGIVGQRTIVGVQDQCGMVAQRRRVPHEGGPELFLHEGVHAVPTPVQHMSFADHYISGQTGGKTRKIWFGHIAAR